MSECEPKLKVFLGQSNLSSILSLDYWSDEIKGEKDSSNQ